MKLHKNDKVKIIAGKDLGQEGVVERVFIKSDKVLVTGINLATRHLKKSAQNKEGGRIKIAKPIDVSNAMLICPKCNKSARIGSKTVDGKKYRVCKKCGEVV